MLINIKLHVIERLKKHKAKQVRVLALKQYCKGPEFCNQVIAWES